MVRLVCDNCNNQYRFSDAELEVEKVSSEERQMGNENTFSAIIEFDCKYCNQHITAEFNFWEYPSLVLNYSEHSEEGCILLEEPDYKIYLKS